MSHFEASPETLPAERAVTIAEFQALMREMFGAKDAARGTAGTFLWFMEEVGELASALREGRREDRPPHELDLEFADVLAWLVTLANIAGVDLDAAVKRKYGGGCPRCGLAVCGCDPARKP